MPTDALFYDELAPLLASVSRSFFLSIKFLPGGLRSPVGLAYLLARTSDTIADSSDAPAPLRLKCLAAFREMIAQGDQRGGVPFLESSITPADDGERALMAKTERLLQWLTALDPRDRDDVIEVMRDIIHGQELDVERFASTRQITALQTAAELDEYTYLVAGCVGDFWTRLSFRHVKNFAHLDETRMRTLGTAFGKGLQLVNILRDLPADLKAGRCYLPAEELAKSGTIPSQLLSHPAAARPVLNRCHQQAVAHLDDAFIYVQATRVRRMRFACILPWYLGLRTLALLKKTPPLESAARVKVSRREVRRLMLLAPLAACSDYFLTKIRQRLMRAV